MKEKILVAAPTYEGMKYCQERFINAIKKLTCPDYDTLIIDNSRSKEYFNELKKINGIIVIHDDTQETKNIFRLISSRNKIIDFAIKNNYSHILMLDSDVIPPKNIIEQLLKYDKGIISGLYFNYFNVDKKIKYLPVCWKYFTVEQFEELRKKYVLPPSMKKRTDWRRHLTQEEADSNKVHEVAFPSAGCVLIKRNVFEKIRYGHLKIPGLKLGPGDDIYFMSKAQEQGFKIYCNTGVKCQHLVEEKYKKDSNGNLIHSSFSDSE